MIFEAIGNETAIGTATESELYNKGGKVKKNDCVKIMLDMICRVGDIGVNDKNKKDKENEKHEIKALEH